MHISLRVSNRSIAKDIAASIQNEWLVILKNMKTTDVNLTRGRLVLSHPGLISPSELSSETGLSVNHIVRELLSNNIPIGYLAANQAGYLIEDYRAIEKETENDGTPITNSIVLNDAFEKGRPFTFEMSLKPINYKSTLKKILSFGHSDEAAFKIPDRKNALAVFDLPGIRLDTSNIVFSRLRYYSLSFSKISEPETNGKISMESSASATPPALPCICCRPEKGALRCSWIAENFIEKKSANWKPDEKKKMAGLCATFIELMNDPMIGELDRELIWRYESLLRRMPSDRYQAARRHKTDDAKTLIELADKNNEPRLSSLSVEKYMTAVSRMFSWALDSLILTANPARGAFEKGKRLARDQDERDKFENSELAAIFSVDWFKTGTGEKNKHGRYHQFRPYYYWLPLLGLYTGARLNEISQLYLSDIHSENGHIPYIDFNDRSDDDTKASDKSLKNRNSKRAIPIHPKLIALGLIDYAEALKKEGYTRLFPELKHSDIKGYGKAAGKWFNESLLSSKLKMPRNGRKTFHSFRHTFITALYNLDIPEDIQAQISGHSRGESMGARRYRKDAETERLLKYLEKVDFELPNIHSFKISDGLKAVMDALARKRPIE